MTPVKFAALSDRFSEAQDRQDFRMGNIMALVANVNRGKKGKTYKAQDFMPSQIRNQGKKKAPSELHSLFKGLLGGQIRDKEDS